MTDVLQIKRLMPGEWDLARALFTMIAQVFEDEAQPLSDAYLERLLAREDFWALAAFAGSELVGGLTAHILPMTRWEGSEVMIYDIAVREAFQRRGVGRALLSTLREDAAAQGIAVVFVLADDEDQHALDFYRALGGEPAPVTAFTFTSDR